LIRLLLQQRQQRGFVLTDGGDQTGGGIPELEAFPLGPDFATEVHDLGQ
jgi:hypothetical protein